jgi:hypothetical protein
MNLIDSNLDNLIQTLYEDDRRESGEYDEDE